MQKHGIDADEKILLFNGLLDYGPNLDALRVILDKVNPELLQVKNFRYRLIVCGARLPENLKGLASYGDKHITYAGFVDDISIYFKAADVFLNPVQTGGGIKTKMVEAIAYGANVVSTESSATGISRKVCGEKLSVVEDDDWEAFTLAIIKASSQVNITPEAYYHFYDWKYIIENILQS
jgi:glycosyltransferase involved in cell wall biosynthesis